MTTDGFVTVILTLPIEPSNLDAIQLLYRELGVLEKSMTVSGAIDTWIAQPLNDIAVLTVFTRWTSATGYDTWCADPRREEILEDLLPLLAGAPSSVMYASSERPVTAAAL